MEYRTKMWSKGRLPNVLVAALGLSLLATVAHAEPLQGNWAGSGYVKPKDGQR